ncbi:hypothetical protein KFL_010740010 [Klebsormidium nitens]|uniref:Uncharacterized protein n=1 Tax=Klebsormidium nitens TaxID=105231 RepID=A0A1Y1ITG1_KLENI|nr:hypothetical protein KFL_010740010 [Klebsormidium nitens]|eukprot:GAQ92621.1 hypothetical protein KFL_010740010 [Klebsormidium nitens]
MASKHQRNSARPSGAPWQRRPSKMKRCARQPQFQEAGQAEGVDKRKAGLAEQALLLDKKARAEKDGVKDGAEERGVVAVGAVVGGAAVAGVGEHGVPHRIGQPWSGLWGPQRRRGRNGKWQSKPMLPERLHRPRVIYAKYALTAQQKSSLELQLEDVFYTCGNPLFPGGTSPVVPEQFPVVVQPTPLRPPPSVGDASAVPGNRQPAAAHGLDDGATPPPKARTTAMDEEMVDREPAFPGETTGAQSPSGELPASAASAEQGSQGGPRPVPTRLPARTVSLSQAAKDEHSRKPVHEVAFVRQGVTCADDVERTYYAQAVPNAFNRCCKYCGDMEDLVEDDPNLLARFATVLPICAECKAKGRPVCKYAPKLVVTGLNTSAAGPSRPTT